MTGRVPRVPRDLIGDGGFAEVYKGNLTRLCTATEVSCEGGDKDMTLIVAIKSIRDCFKNNEKVEKVCL